MMTGRVRKGLWITFVVLMVCGIFAPLNTWKVKAASSKVLAVNWNNIASVGNQPQGSDACACYSLAYCRTMLDGRVHSWSEYDVNGGNPYNSCASWTKGGYGYVAGVSTAQAAYRACYDSINNNRPAILFVTGSRSTGHYVTVIGYQNVSNANSLSASNFLIIDSCWFCSKSSPENMAAAGYSAKNDDGYYYHTTNTGSVVSYDTNKSVITNVKVTELTAAGYKIECDITNDSANQIKSVYFPTWTQNKDQDDLNWHKATYSNKHASFYVKASEHKNETGTYVTHIYCCAENASSFNVSCQVGKAIGTTVNVPVSGTVTMDASFTKPSTYMKLGVKIPVGGTIRSDINIGKVTMGVYSLDGTAAIENVINNVGSKNYLLNNIDTSKIQAPGVYKFKISAATSKRTTALLDQSIVVLSNNSTIEDGEYAIKCVGDMIKAVTVTKGINAVGDSSDIGVSTYKDEDAQHFNIRHLGNGLYSVVNAESGYGMEVKNAGSASGTNVFQGEVKDYAGQRWYILPTNDGTGSYCFVAECAPTCCMDVSGGKYNDGDTIKVNTNKINASQRFLLESVKSDTPDVDESKIGSGESENAKVEDKVEEKAEEKAGTTEVTDKTKDQIISNKEDINKTSETRKNNETNDNENTSGTVTIPQQEAPAADEPEDDSYELIDNVDDDIDAPVIKKIRNVKKRSIKLQLRKQTAVDGYEYTIAKVTNKTLKKFKKKINNSDGDAISFKGAKTYTSKSSKIKLSGLKKRKRYAVVVRAYQIVEGEKYYSDYSAVKSVVIKK